LLAFCGPQNDERRGREPENVILNHERNDGEPDIGIAIIIF